MTVTVKTITVYKAPADDIDFLRPHAIRAGLGDSDAAVARFALIEYAKQLRAARHRKQLPRHASRRKAG